MTLAAKRPKQKNAKRRAAGQANPGGMRVLRWSALGVFLATLSFGGAKVAWHFFGPQLTQGEQYRLKAENIETTPPPNWIRTDVKAEVIRDGSLHRDLSILDENLAQLVAAAFELHPWVAKAQVTKKYPARLTVALTYRRPVVAVQLAGAGQFELHLFDVEGVHLPGDDFSPQEKRRLARLVGIEGLPPVGQKASDPNLLGGARLAALLEDVWDAWQFDRIVPPHVESLRRGQYGEKFEIVTRDATRIVWGANVPAEPDQGLSDYQKLQRLRSYRQQHGLSDGHQAPKLIDVETLPGNDDTAMLQTEAESKKE